MCVWSRIQKCYRCITIQERHENVLQFQMSSCEPPSQVLSEPEVDPQKLCQMIPPDEPFSTLVRLSGEDSPCPFDGEYSFTYSMGKWARHQPFHPPSIHPSRHGRLLKKSGRKQWRGERRKSLYLCPLNQSLKSPKASEMDWMSAFFCLDQASTSNGIADPICFPLDFIEKTRTDAIDLKQAPCRVRQGKWPKVFLVNTKLDAGNR